MPLLKTHPNYNKLNSNLDNAFAKLTPGECPSDSIHEELESAKKEWDAFLKEAKKEGYTSSLDEIDTNTVFDSSRFGRDLSEGISLEKGL
jgi:hypothetical protein